MTEEELQALVEMLSLKYFKRPFKHRARFNPRLQTTGGRYLLSSHDLELNQKMLTEHSREVLIGTIKHELCHYHLHLEKRGYRHRDQDFKQLLKKSVVFGLHQLLSKKHAIIINVMSVSKIIYGSEKLMCKNIGVVSVEASSNCSKKFFKKGCSV